MVAALITGTDHITRCGWAAASEDYRAYHDEEWGMPVLEERLVFERLCLEGFQAGLSWLTILRKREGFRSAFAHFDPEIVARFGDADLQRLLGDGSIVRHRGKIAATISNAQAVVRLRRAGVSLSGLFWSREPTVQCRPKELGDVPAYSAEARSLSSELRGLGFRFVGPTTVYAAMQALGVVNDHLVGCESRRLVEKAREALPTRH